MDFSKKEYQIISKTLFKKGAFAISDLIPQSQLSRSGWKKILKKLVTKKILKTTTPRGSLVKYKLTDHPEAIDFIFHYYHRLTLLDFARFWQIQKNSAQKKMKKLLEQNVLQKIGTPPKKIIYILPKLDVNQIFSEQQKKALQKYYAYTTPDGQFLTGLTAFLYWAKNKSQRTDFQKLAEEYLITRKKYYGNNEKILLIDASKKLTAIFKDQVYIKKLFHRDFDALPVFGKTALSQLIRIAKSGQKNIVLMSKIVDKIQESVDEIVQKYQIEAIAFIPPTVARQTQLMTFLAQHLKFTGPKIKLAKEKSLVPVQQKSLKKVEDRILNARETITFKTEKKFQNILLIDDVTGSGATLNETAKKLISQNVAQKVYAFTITGSAKAGVFDVISEA